MNRFRFLIVINAIFLLASCGGSARVVDGNGVVYSEYFEDIHYLEDHQLKIHSIETLGRERLPKSYQLTDFEKSYLNSPDTAYSVFEIYFTNESNTPITLSAGKYGSRGSNGDLNEKFTIAPGQWAKTTAQVSVSSIFGPNRASYYFEIVVEEKHYRIEGQLTRLTIEELNSLTSKGSR